MSHKFGEVFQVAWVVPDVEKAIDHWTQVIGVGPFFHFPLPLPFEWARAYGKDIDPKADLYEALAVSYSGDTMIELIQPGSHPSTYRDFLDSGKTGVHHLGTYTDRLDEQVAAAKAEGIEVCLEGDLPISRFAYLDTAKGFQGTIMEIIEPRPLMISTLDHIKRACRDWDGKTRLGQM